MRKINKHKIALKRKEILDKAENSKWKEIKYNWMEEILNVKEKMLHKRLGIRGLYPRSKRPNKIVEKQILTDSMLRIIL